MNARRPGPGATVTIAGCGALGSLLALRLCEAGLRVQAYQRPGEQLQALREHGITLEGDRDGATRRCRLIEAAADPAQLAPTQLVIVLVKAYQSAELGPLRDILTDDGVVLTLQNGLGGADELAGLFGPERVAAGVATYGAYRKAPGVIGWGGDGQITLGPWAGGDFDRIAALLRGAGLDARAVADPRPAIWTKLAINAMLNTVSSLTGLRNGEVGLSPPAMQLMQRLGRETVEAAARAGIPLDFDAVWQAMLVNLERTAANRTSMLQDVAAGRRTEIDAISGAVLRYARDDADFPATRTVYDLIKTLDLRVG